MMNLKWSKKFLSLVLVLVMTVLAIPVSVSASEAMLVHDLLSELGITIEIDNEQQIVVREVTSYGSVLSTNDRISNILTIEKFDSHGNIISVDVVNLDITFEQNGYIDIQPFNQSQTTFSNREYWMRTSWFSAGSHSDPHWEIRSGNSRRSGLESQVNSHSDLMAFRSVVGRVNSAEWALAAIVGGTIIAAVVTGLLTGGKAAAIAVAGGSGAAIAAIAVLSNAINDADFYFSRVWFTT